MELKVFWRTLRRRWYLTLGVLVLTIGSTAYVVNDVGPTYEAEGSALVFPPASSTRSGGGGKKTVGNPYLELAGVSQARDVVIRNLKSRTVGTDWGEKFPGMSYEVTPDFTNSAPIILFTVEGDTSVGAAAALEDLMSRVPLVLDDLQAGLGLSPDGLVTARKLTQDARPAIVRKTQIRAGLLAAAVSGGLGLLLLALFDSLLGVRTRIRAEKQARATQESALSAENPVEPDEPAERDADATQAGAEDDVGTEAEGAMSDVDVEAQETEETEETEEAEPGSPNRTRVDSTLAVSPARSEWSRESSSPDSTQNARPSWGGASAPHPTGSNATPSRNHGPRSLAAMKARTRDFGRNR